MTRRHLLAMITGVALISAATATGELLGPGGMDLDWNTVDGGGGTSSNGSLAVSGTLGQWDASETLMTGGVFTLAGGFWPGAAPSCETDITPPGGNGSTDIDDLLLIINSWGPSGGNGPADLDHNGTVDIDDLLSVITAWGVCP